MTAEHTVEARMTAANETGKHDAEDGRTNAGYSLHEAVWMGLTAAVVEADSRGQFVGERIKGFIPAMEALYAAFVSRRCFWRRA